MNMHAFRLLISMLILFGTPACKESEKSREEIDKNTPQPTSQEEELPKGQTFVFQCENDFQFTARLEGNDAWLYTEDTTLHLEHVPSDAGEKYTNGTVTFWNNGSEASLELGGKSYKHCKTE